MSLDFRIGIGPYFDDTYIMEGTTDDHFRRRVELWIMDIQRMEGKGTKMEFVE